MKYSGSAPAFLDRLAMLLALLAGLSLYLPALRLELLADDFVFLARARTLSLLPWLGTTGGASYYRPVSRQIYFWGMSHLFRERACGGS